MRCLFWFTVCLVFLVVGCASDDSEEFAPNETAADYYAGANAFRGFGVMDAFGNYGEVADGRAHYESPTSETLTFRDSVNLLMGTPAKDTADGEIPLERREYSMAYDVHRNAANWVSWRVQDSDYGSEGRTSNFRREDLLPAQYRYRGNDSSIYRPVTDDYLHSGFHRGHIVRSRDRSSTAEANRNTYVMSNVLPMHPHLNTRPWLNLELYLERMALELNKFVYIVAGPVWDAANRTGLDVSRCPPGPRHVDDGCQSVGREEDPTHRVAVPNRVFKIAVVTDAGTPLQTASGAWNVRADQVIAVMMQNDEDISFSWLDHIVTVDDIEAATGYDFLSNLPVAQQALVEGSAGRFLCGRQLPCPEGFFEVEHDTLAPSEELTGSFDASAPHEVRVACRNPNLVEVGIYRAGLYDVDAVSRFLAQRPCPFAESAFHISMPLPRSATSNADAILHTMKQNLTIVLAPNGPRQLLVTVNGVPGSLLGSYHHGRIFDVQPSTSANFSALEPLGWEYRAYRRCVPAQNGDGLRGARSMRNAIVEWWTRYQVLQPRNSIWRAATGDNAWGQVYLGFSQKAEVCHAWRYRDNYEMFRQTDPHVESDYIDRGANVLGVHFGAYQVVYLGGAYNGNWSISAECRGDHVRVWADGPDDNRAAGVLDDFADWGTISDALIPMHNVVGARSCAGVPLAGFALSRPWSGRIETKAEGLQLLAEEGARRVHYTCPRNSNRAWVAYEYNVAHPWPLRNATTNFTFPIPRWVPITGWWIETPCAEGSEWDAPLEALGVAGH